MNKQLFALAGILLAVTFLARAQPQESFGVTLVGTWVGDWRGARPGSGGSMEMVVEVKGDKVFGQVRSTGSPGCSLEWARLTGVVKDTKVFADYDLGGRCRRVDITYSIDQGGQVMTGTWSSQYPGSGTFRLNKQPSPPTSSATGTAPNSFEQKQ